MNKITKLEEKLFENCKTRKRRLDVNNKYIIGGKQEGWQLLSW